MKSWFLSDIHLKNLNERNGEILLRFLFFLNQNPSQHRLFLLGDIFDFWLSDGNAFQQHYKKLIEQISYFKANGGQVFYFEGNHDLHVDVFWTKKFNIPVYENEAYFTIDNLIVRLEHGDFINPEDKAYLKYRSFIRHPVLEFIGHLFPSLFWKWFGEKMSQKSRKKTASYSILNTDKIRTLIRAHAERSYKLQPFDLIITGHMHVFDDFSFQASSDPANVKNVRSVNLGTWLEEPKVMCLHEGKIEFSVLS